MCMAFFCLFFNHRSDMQGYKGDFIFVESTVISIMNFICYINSDIINERVLNKNLIAERIDIKGIIVPAKQYIFQMKREEVDKIRIIQINIINIIDVLYQLFCECYVFLADEILCLFFCLNTTIQSGSFTHK